MVSPTPAPIEFAPSQEFDGNDGKWSTFTVRVGAPGQHFRVLPASRTGETIIPLVDGCIESDPPNCGALRGAYPFNGHPSNGFLVNKTSSWHEIGLYDTDLNKGLNYSANALYGLDTVGLGVQNSGGVNLTDRVIGGIASKDYYLGLFGLSPKASNFSEFDYPQNSFIRALKDNAAIPSISYGYTAGAYYKSPKVLGSLTLGGFDESRAKSNRNPITFPFDTDDSRPLSLKIQRISASNTLLGEVSLLERETYVQIDFTVPHLWLPEETCNRFAESFGLSYDNFTGLYLVNSTIHNELVKRNPSVKLSLGNSLDPNARVNVELPYGAFDLQASHPIYPNATAYFPIRKGANESQWTLGRVFLQEAYIVVDHERGNFSVYQAQFPATNEPKRIIPIPSPDIEQHTRLYKGFEKALNRGAIAGIIVGAVFVIAILVVAVFGIRRRRRKAVVVGTSIVEPISQTELRRSHEEKQPLEMAAHDSYEMHSTMREELDGTVKYELFVRSPHELPADVPNGLTGHN